MNSIQRFSPIDSGLPNADLLERAFTSSCLLNGLSSDQYFRRLVQLVAELTEADYAFVSELDQEKLNSSTIAVWAKNKFIPNFEYALAGTPCMDLCTQGMCFFDRNVASNYPDDQMLTDMSIEGYMGTVLKDHTGQPFGLLVALFESPIQNADELQKIFTVFDERAANELQRLHYESTLNDTIAELQRQNAELKVAQHVFDNTADGIMVTDHENRITSVNPAFTKITGYSEQDVLGHDPRILGSGRHDQLFYAEMWQSVLQGHWQGEVWNRRKNGEIYPIIQSVTSVRNQQHEITHFISVFSDVSAIKDIESKMEFMAHHDALTGLPNRMLFNAHLDRALAYAQRHNKKAAVLMLDVDRFKLVNDTLGHGAGDELLVKMGERIRHSIRQEDTVARLGGDEFALILNEIDSVEDAIKIAQKIIECIARPTDISSKRIVSSASIGIGIYPNNADNALDLMRAADTAMYRAKNSGRNTYDIYTADLGTRAEEHLNLESDLRRALVNDELTLFYQPFMDIESGRICGLESLLRWQHPQRGTIMPDEFIPIAEESDLIDQIGLWVLRKALDQVSEWSRQGLHTGRIAINVSGRQVIYGNLAESVRLELRERGHTVNDAQLELEITENVLLSLERSKTVFDDLRACGAMISIDDFGTGYSSLSLLRNMPVDTVKIDRSFLANVPSSKDGATIVRAIVSMAKSLGLRVIAEGVETEQQLDFLRSLGCNEAQGFLIGRPADAVTTSALLHQGLLH